MIPCLRERVCDLIFQGKTVRRRETGGFLSQKLFQQFQIGFQIRADGKGYFPRPRSDAEIFFTHMHVDDRTEYFFLENMGMEKTLAVRNHLRDHARRTESVFRLAGMRRLSVKIQSQSAGRALCQSSPADNAVFRISAEIVDRIYGRTACIRQKFGAFPAALSGLLCVLEKKADVDGWLFLPDFQGKSRKGRAVAVMAAFVADARMQGRVILRNRVAFRDGERVHIGAESDHGSAGIRSMIQRAEPVPVFADFQPGIFF